MRSKVIPSRDHIINGGGAPLAMHVNCRVIPSASTTGSLCVMLAMGSPTVAVILYRVSAESVCVCVCVCVCVSVCVCVCVCVSVSHCRTGQVSAGGGPCLAD